MSSRVYLSCWPRLPLLLLLADWNAAATMYRITNIYVLAAFGTIGGALFGFDIRYGYPACSVVCRR